MMRGHLVLIAFLFPVLVLAAPSGSGNRARERLGKADADRNGLLSRAEVERGLPELIVHFRRIDADADGGISADELRAWRKARARRPAGDARSRFDEHFNRADSDGDGALSRQEAKRGMPRLAAKFRQVDADGDGRLSRDEVHAWLDTRRTARTR